MQRIDHELQKVIGTLISQELKDPRLGFTTVTRVEVTQDLRHAKVFVSIIGDRHVAKQTMDALEHAARYLRGGVGQQIKLRHTPELQFVEDRSTERAINLTKTLRSAQSPPVPADSSAIHGASDASGGDA